MLPDPIYLIAILVFLGLAPFLPRGKAAPLGHDPPPWQIGRGGEYVANRPSRSGKPGLRCHFAVGHDVAGV